MIRIPTPAFIEFGLCAQVGSDAWYPEQGSDAKAAKAICRGCEVRVECLDWALANDERHGIWGGLSEMDRRRLRRGHAPRICALASCGKTLPLWVAGQQRYCDANCSQRTRDGRRRAKDEAVA